MAWSGSGVLKISLDREAAHRILRSVPYVQGFHFFTPAGDYTGETAISLFTFSMDLKAVDSKSLRYHFQRGDFQKWIGTILGDEELAERITKIDSRLSDEDLRRELLKALQRRLEELQTLSESPYLL